MHTRIISIPNRLNCMNRSNKRRARDNMKIYNHLKFHMLQNSSDINCISNIYKPIFTPVKIATDNINDEFVNQSRDNNSNIDYASIDEKTTYCIIGYKFDIILIFYDI